TYDGSRNLGRTVDQASSGAHDVIDEVSRAARPAVDRVATSAHRAVDKLASVAGQAVDTLGVKGEQLKKFQGEAIDQVRGYVRDNPVASIGIALAAGYLLSKLLSSR
ncbi:MAG: hypothetical protein ABI619_04915, partial [Betaproteobacteria bacterium]